MASLTAGAIADPLGAVNGLLTHSGPLTSDAKFRVYSMAMRLQQEVAKMHLQMSALQSQMRRTDTALQELVDLVIEEVVVGQDESKQNE